MNTLASDAFEGRQAGSRGGKAAAAYLRSELKALRESHLLPREQTQEFGAEYQNLLVLLPGSDDKLSREVIVVGAHYDHVGYGNSSNSRGPIGKIHNGADDNASGTSALLEMIEAFLPSKSLRRERYCLHSGTVRKPDCWGRSTGSLIRPSRCKTFASC